MRQVFLLIFISVLSLVSTPSFATIDVYEFETPELEERFKLLTHELRCPKCQNQNLAGSNSTLSLDLKMIVYEKLIAGETDQQILDFMKKRYGEFILFKPEMNQSNVFLWVAPFIFVIIFLILFLRWYMTHKDVEND